MTLQLPITDFLTAAEIDQAVVLFRETAGKGTFAERCKSEIIEPVLPRINAKLGQENDAKYLAYAVEYVLIRAGRGN